MEGGEELFGAKHEDLVMVKEPGERSRWMTYERRFGEFDPPTWLAGAGAFDGHKLMANLYLQTLTPTTSEPILFQGDRVAGVMNQVGSGRGILIGSFLGFSALAYRDQDDGADAFLEALLASAAVTPDRCGTLLRRRREWQGREAWFFINPAATAVTETIDKAGFSTATDLLGDNLVDQNDTSLTIQIKGANLACLLLSS